VFTRNEEAAMNHSSSDSAVRYFVLNISEKSTVLNPDKVVRLGRGQNINVRNPLVSRLHAIVGIDENGVYIADVGNCMQGSANGTYINAERLEPLTRYYITKHDLITLGDPSPITGSEVSLEKFKFVCAA
jgi:pSer/pThr/pTyr-binding forkhead associated (FHA) protein